MGEAFEGVGDYAGVVGVAVADEAEEWLWVVADAGAEDVAGLVADEDCFAAAGAPGEVFDTLREVAVF